MASLFERVVFWLRTRRGPARHPPLWSVLRDRGASRELVRFVDPFGADLASAWSECPRAEWTIELAALAPITAERLVDAVAHLTPEASADALAASRARAVAVARAHAAGEADVEALVVATHALCCAIIERETEEVASIPAPRDPERAWTLQGQFDALYAEAQARLAERVREVIALAEVRVAYEGLEAHPYR